MNETLQILDMFSYQDSISHTRIFWVIELTDAVIASISFFKKGILKNVKKN